MRKVKIGKYAVPLWLIVVMLVSGIGASTYYIWQTLIIPLEVKEPLEIVSYPERLSLYPGETIYKLLLPSDANSWLYSLRISSELADTIVYQPIVGWGEITSCTWEDGSTSTTIPAGQSKNIIGEVKQTEQVDSAPLYVSGICKQDYVLITGGLQKTYLSYLETSKFTLKVYNYGPKEATFNTPIKVVCYNSLGTETDNVTLTADFGAGAQNQTQPTYLMIYVENTAGTKLIGMYITVNFGTEERNGYSLKEGKLFDLGTYYGTVSIMVQDLSTNSTYKTATDTITVEQSKTNYKTITMIRIGENPTDWEKYLPYIVGGSIGLIGLGVGVYALKRKRYGYGRFKY